MSCAVSDTYAETPLQQHHVRSSPSTTLPKAILTVSQRHMARARAREYYPQDWSQLAVIPRYPLQQRILDWLAVLEPAAPDDE